MNVKNFWTSTMAWSLLISLLIPLALAPAASLAAASERAMLASTHSPQVEPNAGKWQTWVLTAGNELRPPAPPNQAATRKELAELQALVAKRDTKALEQIAYWDAGSPGYRWLQLAQAQILSKPMNVPRRLRLLSLLNVAIYDATIAAWDAKYVYNRKQPSVIDPKLVTVLPDPASPSYPSEHAVAAGAASAIFAYIYPDEAKTFADLAAASGQSRLLAGVNFPSDVKAGLALGQAVAAKVIERAQADGSDAPWTGTVPTGPGMWIGDKPVEPLMGTWQAWVLESGDQLRLPPPSAHDSAEKVAELTEIKTLTRTFAINAAAFYWQSDRSFFGMYDWASSQIFEQGLDRNPPRAARIYALMSVAGLDSMIACYDSKYAYWSIRPSQLDPAVKPLFPPPPHPSYPSGHACNSGSVTGLLAWLFPSGAQTVTALADEAAMSRMWAGIHYRSDDDAGLVLGRQVAELVIEWAEADGSQ